MSSNDNVDFHRPKLDILGSPLQLLAGPEEFGTDIGFLAGDVPPGGIIPLHSHGDVEVIAVLEGALDVYRGSGTDAGWKQASAGDIIVISGGVKHALRNKQDRFMRSVFVTQGKLFKFFAEVGVPVPAVPGPPTPEQFQKFMGAAAANGYWMASPQENAEIGLELPMPNV